MGPVWNFWVLQHQTLMLLLVLPLECPLLVLIQVCSPLGAQLFLLLNYPRGFILACINSDRIWALELASTS